MLNTTELGLEFPEGDFRSIFNSEKRLDVTIAVLVGRGQGFQGRETGLPSLLRSLAFYAKSSDVMHLINPKC